MAGKRVPRKAVRRDYRRVGLLETLSVVLMVGPKVVSWGLRTAA